jgi:hypothetical protein
LIWTSIRELPVWVRLLVLGRFINAAGALAWIYLTVYLVQERGLEPSLAGIIMGGNGFGMLAGNLMGGWFGDRFGNKPTLLAGYLGWALLCLTFPIAGTPYLLPIAITAGFAAGSGQPVGVALVTAAVPPEQRRVGVAITRAAMNAGIVIGPPLGALAAAYDFSLVFIIDALTSLVLTAIVWRWVPSTPTPSKADYRRGYLRAVLRDRKVLALVAGVVLLDTAYRQLFTGLPLMLQDQLLVLRGPARGQLPAGGARRNPAGRPAGPPPCPAGDHLRLDPGRPGLRGAHALARPRRRDPCGHRHYHRRNALQANISGLRRRTRPGRDGGPVPEPLLGGVDERGGAQPSDRGTRLPVRPGSVVALVLRHGLRRRCVPGVGRPLPRACGGHGVWVKARP